jgi:hypothetical protein
MAIGTHLDLPAEIQAAIQNAIAVVDAHMAALNAREPDAIAKTLHFPHYRLAGSVFKVWETPDTYLDDFYARAGEGWGHSQWNRQDVIHAEAEKVHLDMEFTRFRTDGSELGTYRSIWVITRIDGRWAAQLRSSFAR